MKDIKAMRISDADASKVCGGIKIRTYLNCDGTGDVVDEERLQGLLQAFNIAKDNVVINSSVSMSADTKNGIVICDELSFEMKIPVSVVEQSPYFLAISQQLDSKSVEIADCGVSCINS